MRTVWLTLLMLPIVAIGAEAVIYRCSLEDSTVAFQEIPCVEPVEASDDEDQNKSEETEVVDEFFEFVNPFDEAEGVSAALEPDLPSPPSQDRAECEKTTRDAIDAIDMEMRKGYTKQEGKVYLAELLELTRELRRCKQL